MHPVTNVLVAIACIVGIAVGGLYIQQKVHWGCLLGNCAVIITK